MTDLAETVRDPWELLAAQIAERIAAGKRPTKAQAEWYALLRPPVAQNSVEKNRSVAKGETGIVVKTYDPDPFEAARINDEIFMRQRAKWPMQDGTVGAPMKEDAA